MVWPTEMLFWSVTLHSNPKTQQEKLMRQKLSLLLLFVLVAIAACKRTASSHDVSCVDASCTDVACNTAVFAHRYGARWVRLRMFADSNYTAGVSTLPTTIVGSTQVGNLAAEEELWCLVGEPAAFKLYNKATGRGYALSIAEAKEGAAATMVKAKEATSWKLLPMGEGYAIVPVGEESLSLNAFGGKGNALKLYAANDPISQWVCEPVGEKTLALSVTVDGSSWEPSPRVAELNVSVDGVNSHTRITGNVKKLIHYLPVHATKVSVNSITYRGHQFLGFEAGDGQLVSSITDMELHKGLHIKAHYAPHHWRTLYYTPDVKGYPYRIPAIATAPNGHVFAIADNRPCYMDIGYGEVDIKCRISTDHGNTWSDEFYVADGQGGNTNVMATGFGDAAIVADCEQNRLLVMMVCGRTVCWNGRWNPAKSLSDDAVNRVARVYAAYNDATAQWEWTQPEEVTNDIYTLFLDAEGQPTVSSMFIGSGKICQSRVVKKGDYYRLYCSMWTRDGGNRVIYSDDFGGSWHILGTVSDRPAPYGDESKVEELPDGTVVLSSRKGGGRYFNLFTFSDDTFTIGTWGTAVSSNNVEQGLSFGANSTNGEIMLVSAVRQRDGALCDLMLQSVPSGNGRRDVAIYYKEMEYHADGSNAYTPSTFAQGWVKGVQPSDRGSAYSTMTLQKDGRVGFLYEEEPGGYCIVYAPLTIEEITLGNYTLAP